MATAGVTLSTCWEVEVIIDGEQAEELDEEVLTFPFPFSNEDNFNFLLLSVGMERVAELLDLEGRTELSCWTVVTLLSSTKCCHLAVGSSEMSAEEIAVEMEMDAVAEVEGWLIELTSIASPAGACGDAWSDSGS